MSSEPSQPSSGPRSTPPPAAHPGQQGGGAGALIATNSAWLLAGKLGASFLSLLFFAFVANRLRPEVYGTFNVIQSLASLVQVLLDLGYMTLLIERSSKDRSQLQWHYDGNLGLKLVLYPAGLLLYGSLLLYFPFSGGDLVAFLLCFVIVIANVQTYLVRGALMSLETFQAIGKSEVIERCVILGAGFLIILARPTLEAFVLVLALAAVLRLLYLVRELRRLGIRGRWRWDGDYVRSNFAAAWPYGLMSITGVVQFRVDQIVIREMLGPGAVGHYAAAFDKVYGLALFGMLVSQAIAPTAARMFVENRAEFRRIFDRSFFLIGLLAAPAAVGVGVCARGIVGLLHTADYGESVVVLAWLAPYLLLRGWMYVYGAMFLAAGAIGRQVVAESLGIGVKLALYAWLVPSHGLAGAGAAFFGAEVATLLVAAVLSTRVGLPFLPLHRVWQPVLAAVLMGWGVWALRGQHVLVQVGAGGIIYPALALLLGVHRREPGIGAFARRFLARIPGRT